MNIESRKKLYNQLVQMSIQNQKQFAKKILSEEDFYRLSDSEALKYVFMYRDAQTEFIVDGIEYVSYIELPDMNLEGQDLSDLYLKNFILGEAIVDENGNISNITPSRVNLKNTGAIVDLSNMYPNKIQKNKSSSQSLIIDFTGSNFEGCEIYGILPDEYGENDVSVVGKEALDSNYLERRKNLHLSKKEKKVTDRAFERLRENKILSGMKNQNLINFSDYDIACLSSSARVEIQKKKHLNNHLSRIRGYEFKVKKDYFNNQELLENAYKNGNIKLFKDIISLLSPELQYKYILLAFEEGLLDFNYLWKKLDEKFKSVILSLEAEKGNANFVISNFQSANESVKPHIMSLICKLAINDLDFFGKNWKYIDEQDRIKILRNNINDIRFVNSYIYQISDIKIREELIHAINTIINERKEKNERITLEENFRISEEQKKKEAYNAFNRYKSGKEENIYKYFEFLNLEEQKFIVDTELERKNDFFFKKLFFYDESDEIKSYIAEKSFERKDSEVFDKFCNSYDSIKFNQILREKLENGEDDFLVKYVSLYRRTDMDIVTQVVEKEYVNNKNLKIVLDCVNRIDINLVKKILKIEYKNNNLDYVKELIENCMKDKVIEILKAFRINDIYKIFTKSEKEFINEFREQFDDSEDYNYSGEFICEELKSKNIDMDFVIRLIRNGALVNEPVLYKNSDGSKEYVSVLYSVMKVNDNKKRDILIRELINAGINIKRAGYIRKSGIHVLSNIKCIDMRDGELKKYYGMYYSRRNNKVLKKEEER